MSNFSPTPSAETPRPEMAPGIDPAVYDTLVQAMEAIEAGAGSPVMYEDDSAINTSSASNGELTEVPQVTIRYRAPVPELSGMGQQVSVERFTAEGQALATASFHELLPEGDYPIGSVSFMMSIGAAELTGDIMPTAQGRVVAMLESRFGEDDLLTDGVMQGYELARRLGVGDLWVKSLQQAGQKDQTTVQSLGELDTLDAQRLVQSLQTPHGPSATS